MRRMMDRSAVFYMLLAFALPALAFAASDGSIPGDPVAGARLAERDCSRCHDVSRDGADNPLDRGPAFADVANQRSTTALSLRVFFRSTHREMPDIILSTREQDDVIAYILSLRRR